MTVFWASFSKQPKSIWTTVHLTHLRKGVPARAALSLTMFCAAPAGIGAQQAARPSQDRASAPTATPGPLVFESVTVVDVSGGRLLPDQSVVVSGNRVQTVGHARTVRVPKGAQVVDGRGRYLMPGLWDMHVHVWNRPQIAYPLFVATGVTGVREMSQVVLDSMLQWRRDIFTGARVGPRVIGTGGFLSGGSESSSSPLAIRANTPDEARRAVDSLKAAGADLIKFRDYLPRDAYFAMAAESRRLGIPFVGHTQGDRVTAIEASDSGQRSVEHVEDFPACYSLDSDRDWAYSQPKLKSPGLEECKATAARFARNGTWLTPTILPTLHRKNTALMSAVKLVTDMMHRAGVSLLAGTDAGVPAVPYGFSLHEELTCLAEAGLTPAEALRTATINPAAYLNGTDSLGAVAPGKLADLVLLDADPLADIHNTTKIRAVVANGRYFDRAALDALIAGTGVVPRIRPNCAS